MQEPNTNPEVSVAELQQQIENLNKGIAQSRQEAKEAKESAESARAEAQAAKAALEEASKSKTDADGEEIAPLTPQDAKRLEAWAKSQGFATKEEILAERQRIQGETLKTVETQAIDTFLKDHPEYEKDENWDKLKAEFSQYKQPTTLAEYNRILAKIHKELHPDDGKAKAKAEEETRKRLGLGGGSQRESGETMTVEKMAEKYPRLSKAQIEARLAEIQSLYPTK